MPYDYSHPTADPCRSKEALHPCDTAPLMQIRKATIRSALFTECTLPGLTVDRVTVPAGFSSMRHSHDGYHVLFVVWGQVEDRGHTRTDVLSPEKVRESPPADMHQLLAPTPSRLILITMRPDDLSERLPVLHRRRVTPLRGPNTVPALDAALDSAAPRVLAIEELAMALAGTQTGGSAEPGGRWLEGIMECLHEEFAQPPSLTDLCLATGYTREHVIRSFSMRFGCTMTEYLARRRLQYVCQRLTTDTPLAAIAAESGFCDQSHMTRAVTRVLGRPPGVIRREQRSLAILPA